MARWVSCTCIGECTSGVIIMCWAGRLIVPQDYSKSKATPPPCRLWACTAVCCFYLADDAVQMLNNNCR